MFVQSVIQMTLYTVVSLTRWLRGSPGKALDFSIVLIATEVIVKLLADLFKTVSTNTRSHETLEQL